eukprot:c17864_g2_i1.p1 GENE.c17864_g2_i1~~c17864_g2_i1.p1  ORF type:complete len:195 (-),score=65.63 c17864_g2_i1:133-717(-)
MSETELVVPDRTSLPLSKRSYDLGWIGFFSFMILIIYCFLLEQILISEVGYLKPIKFPYPFWPLPFMVDLTHSFGRSISPIILARPIWWKTFVYLHVLIVGPIFGTSIYAFIESKEWIRVPLVIASTISATMIVVSMFEIGFGAFPAKNQEVCFVINSVLLGLNCLLIYQMTNEHPFSKKLGTRKSLAKKPKTK